MKDNVFRIRFVSICIILVSLFIVARLYLVQIISGEQYASRADRQYVSPTTGVFDRGTIFFQAKDKTLMAVASLKTGYTVAINPKILEDSESAYTQLTQYLTLDRDIFMGKADKRDDPYEEIAKRVDVDTAQKINSLKITGVGVYKDRWRYYPGGSLASHVIGFVGYKNDKLGGRYGLENFYNKVLERNSDKMYVNFFAEIFSDISKSLSKPGEAQGDVISSIEPNVESYVESQIADIQKKYNSKTTGAIIMNPKNGEIYSMAAMPTFDPNTFQTEKDISVFTNPLVQNVYEMGSIIKALTMASGIDAGVVTSATTYFDKGSLTLNGRTIYNFDKRGRGTVDMQEVLDESLNTGAVFVASRLGNQRFAQYMYNFGLGSTTGIDFNSEVKGLTDNLKSPRDIEYATASFGQGIAVSPIAMVRALSVIANGGTLVTPHIATSIDYKTGYSSKINYPQGNRVISPEASTEISRMLTKVVDTSLLKGAVKMEHYSIAAKTGTAQIADKSGGYYSDRYLHSFFGYFPSYDPKFLIFLYTVEPQGEQYSSHTLTEPFMKIINYLINYYEVPPDR